MKTDRTTSTVAVYGATGFTGRLVCRQFASAGIAVAMSGRDRDKLAALHAELPGSAVRVAAIDDPAALTSAFAGMRVVVNCAGPAHITGERVLIAALSAGAHYLDVTSDQAYMHDMYVRHESTARRSERVCLPGAGLECVVGDLAAASAAEAISGSSGAAVLRTIAPERLAERQPFDDVAVSYIFDDLVLSPSSQRAVFDALHARGLMWRRDRWEATGPAAQRRRIDAGDVMGGEREVLSFPGGDVITIPRHIASQSVQTFVSTSRRPAATTALRLLARAIPVVPKRISDVLAPYVPEREDYARTHFAVVARAQRGSSTAQVTVRGADMYRVSAAVTVWIARQLLGRTTGPVGMRAASEVFHPQPALLQVAQTANLTVEMSPRGP